MRDSSKAASDEDEESKPRPLLWVIGTKKCADYQGHSLLAPKLAERNIARHAGWTGSRAEYSLAILLRRFRRYRELNHESSWHLFAGERLAQTASGKTGPRVHFIWGDDFVPLVKSPENCVFTIHQPVEKWTPAFWDALPHCGGIVTMAKRESELLRQRFPQLPVVFIPHGIDTEFWSPEFVTASESPQLICAVGRYMRNYEMLLRVSHRLIEGRKNLHIRWLVNPDFIVPPDILTAIPSERFRIVRNLSPSELRRFYCESWLFFTPYNNVTASNAIVEAMACGIPIFTTRVGGMESYAGKDTGDLFNNNDDEAAFQSLSACLDSKSTHSELSQQSRKRALEEFRWSKITEMHFEFYRELQTANSLA